MHVYGVRLCGYLLIAISCVQQDVRVPLDKDISKILFQSLVQQPCISLTDFPGWVHLIIAMLLLLLRRLETLIIPLRHYCELLVQGVTKWSQESMFPQPKLPLARLETVTVGDNGWDPAKPGQFFVDFVRRALA